MIACHCEFPLMHSDSAVFGFCRQVFVCLFHTFAIWLTILSWNSVTVVSATVGTMFSCWPPIGVCPGEGIVQPAVVVHSCPRHFSANHRASVISGMLKRKVWGLSLYQTVPRFYKRGANC